MGILQSGRCFETFPEGRMRRKSLLSKRIHASEAQLAVQGEWAQKGQAEAVFRIRINYPRSYASLMALLRCAPYPTPWSDHMQLGGELSLLLMISLLQPWIMHTASLCKTSRLLLLKPWQQLSSWCLTVYHALTLFNMLTNIASLLLLAPPSVCPHPPIGFASGTFHSELIRDEHT